MNSDMERRLEAVLEREIEAARSLSKTLDDERAALTGTSHEAVLEQAAHKTELLGTIEQLETERRSLCAAAQITLPPRSPGTPRTPGMVAADDAATVSFTVGERWRSLLELIASCRVANEVNGYIINSRRGHVSQLMHILRGGSSTTYGPQGKTFAKSLRALARA
jgi:flagellar biosynthesis/type III secretory pathway chaperone